MPENIDPDDYENTARRACLICLIEKKLFNLSYGMPFKKIDQNNPYEISKFEKEIKKLSYSIKDEILKIRVRGLSWKIKINSFTTERQNYENLKFKYKKTLRY